MNGKHFSVGRFWLEKIDFDSETWAQIGRISTIAGYLEYSLLETPAYIREGYYGAKFWNYPNGKLGWDRLCDEVKKAARDGNIGPLADEFCRAAGTAKAALKKRGLLSHSVIHPNQNGINHAVSAKISKLGDVTHERFTVSHDNLQIILEKLIKAYDLLHECRSGLSYARGMHGHSPKLKRIAIAAEQLKEHIRSQN